MAARVKSCYNTSAGEFLFGDDPVFTGKDREDFLESCQHYSVLRVCVNSAATDSLIAELEAFDKGFRKLKRHLKDDEGAGENNKGAGSYPTRMLLLIVVLMEKLGISSKEAAERALYDLRFRFALGIEDIHLPVPKERKIQYFCEMVLEFNKHKTKELGREYTIFNEVLANLAASTITYFDKQNYTSTIRLDSTLMGSNISSQSRVEIVTSVLQRYLEKLPYEDVRRLSIYGTNDWDLIQNVFEVGGKRITYEVEGAGKTVMPWLGLCLDSIVKDVEANTVKETPEYCLLERVFLEQFELNEDGVLSPKPGKDISPDSLQNQNDPDASFRKKYATPVRGESVNIAEIVGKHETVTDENGNEVKIQKAPHVITSVDVRTATADDTEFLTPSADAAINIANACGHEVDTIEGDGGYSGIDQRKNMEDKGLTLVTTELKGKEAAFIYSLQEDGTVLVTDRSNTDITYTAVPVNTRDGSKKWKFTTTDENGHEKNHTITERNLEIQEIRELQKDIPAETKKLRNNVEASVRELKRGTYNGKVRYCGIIRILFSMSAKAVGIQTRRIFNFCKRYRIDLSELCQNWK